MSEMLRKTLAITFMMLMTLLITLKHPVLGYCLCLNSYFAGDCCSIQEVDQPAPCSGCCSEVESTAHLATEPQKPCGDCAEILNIDVGDFVWNASNQLPDANQDSNTPPSIDFSNTLSAQAHQLAAAPIRGSPPSGNLELYPQKLPLYLRHSVLRL